MVDMGLFLLVVLYGMGMESRLMMDIDKRIGHPLADKSAPTVWTWDFVNLHNCTLKLCYGTDIHYYII
jgi:hypothetical protein